MRIIKNYLLYGLLLLITDDLYAQDWAVGGNALGGAGADRLFGIQSPNTKNLVFINGSSGGVPVERGRINNTGRWGIGITAPTARFHINSNAGESPFLTQINSESKININSVGGIILGTPSGLVMAPANNTVYVPNRVGIGISTPFFKLQVDGGTDASPVGGGYLVVGSASSNNVAIDDNEILARLNGSASTLFLNNDGGDLNVSDGALVVAASTNRVGIDTTTPGVKLHVEGGSDAGLASGGFIVAGSTTSANVAIDNNEIMARNNGAVSTLFLNDDGGDLNVSAGALVVSGSTNNVGIGVAAPASKLHVSGDVQLSGVSTGILFNGGVRLRDGTGFSIESQGDFTSHFDGVYSLGTSTNSWFEVWATDGTINTSTQG